MNKYVKDFLLRGLIFGGFGPIIFGIIALGISFSQDASLTGSEIFIGIISTYLLAFIHAGASIFNQIEHWPILKSIGIHFAFLYVAYTTCYIINKWIPFDWNFILIFTGIFITVYLLIWIIVYCIVKRTTRQLNDELLIKNN